MSVFGFFGQPKEEAEQAEFDRNACPTCCSFYKEQVPKLLRAPGEPLCPDPWHDRR